MYFLCRKYLNILFLIHNLTPFFLQISQLLISFDPYQHPGKKLVFYNFDMLPLKPVVCQASYLMSMLSTFFIVSSV